VDYIIDLANHEMLLSRLHVCNHLTRDDYIAVLRQLVIGFENKLKYPETFGALSYCTNFFARAYILEKINPGCLINRIENGKDNFVFGGLPDYKAWELKEGERYELIYGEAFAMSAPGTRHQLILGGLFYQFYNFLKGKPCKVFPAPFDVRLFYKEDESDDTVVQPDITVVCDEQKIGSEGCRGAPDLAVEILSPSNTAMEMERKLKLYRQAGIQEYWVVNPENNGLSVYHFKDSPFLFNTYQSTDKVPVSVLPGLTITLEEVFAV
jgi:Uma2 family endonuclease